ncbi:MAG: c-type cytochrome [Rhodocyclaceae bacterium]|nr:c-type cytochrome [Rhodocyclaceae bacterium]
MKNTWPVIVATLVAVLFSSSVAAQTRAERKLAGVLGNAKAVEAAAESGKKSSFFCGNCHGADGNSAIPEVPNLAGQNPVFLLEQIRKFAEGQRKNEFMEKMIRVLSDDDKVNIALYYAQQPVKPRPVGDVALQARGMEWFGKVCIRCHGEQGRGNERIARIAGQQPTYLSLTLTRYRDRTGERIDPLMATNTAFLKDEDIKALVEYVSHMK